MAHFEVVYREHRELEEIMDDFLDAYNKKSEAIRHPELSSEFIDLVPTLFRNAKKN